MDNPGPHRSWLLSWSDFGSKVYKVWTPTTVPTR